LLQNDTLSTSLAHRYKKLSSHKIGPVFWLLGSAKPGVRHDKTGDQLPKRLIMIIKVNGAHVKSINQSINQ